MAQNKMTIRKGDTVKVMVNGDQAKTVYKTFVAEEYKAPVSGTPGEKTLKNFLATALTPVGTSLRHRLLRLRGLVCLQHHAYHQWLCRQR